MTATEPHTHAAKSLAADGRWTGDRDSLRRQLIWVEAEAAQKAVDVLAEAGRQGAEAGRQLREAIQTGGRAAQRTAPLDNWQARDIDGRYIDETKAPEGAAPRAEGLDVLAEVAAALTDRHIRDAGACGETHYPEADRLITFLQGRGVVVGAAPRAEQWDVREAYERGYAEGQRALTDEEDEPMDHHEVNALAYRAGKAIGGALSAGRKEQLHTIEGAAPRAEALQLAVAAVFQDHHPRGEARCECAWRPALSPATNHHEHLMLKVLEVLGVRDE